MYCGNCGAKIARNARFCQGCGAPLQGGIMPPMTGKREAKVKTYASRKAMDRDVQRMVSAGWRVESQSGQFNQRFWLFRSAKDYLTDRYKVTVTYARGG